MNNKITNTQNETNQNLSFLDKVKLRVTEKKLTGIQKVMNDEEVKQAARYLYNILGNKEDARKELNISLELENKLEKKDGKPMGISAFNFDKLIPKKRKTGSSKN